jgi:hypothetical protein
MGCGKEDLRNDDRFPADVRNVSLLYSALLVLGVNQPFIQWETTALAEMVNQQYIKADN